MEKKDYVSIVVLPNTSQLLIQSINFRYRAVDNVLDLNH